MEMGKIEQVIVGGEINSSAEIKSEPVVAPMPAHPSESLQCFQCFITFSNHKAKERHVRKDHPQQFTRYLQKINTLFTCYKCNKSFLTPEELTQHQITHYADKNPFICSDCKKRFSGFSELNKHKRFECGKRPFSCKDCGALFPSAFRLRNHRTAVHPLLPGTPEDISTFLCCKCGCNFKTERELLQHQETFANYQKCGKNLQGKKRGRKPKCVAQEKEEVVKKIKQEEEEQECDEFSAELKIPCSKPDCDCVFPTVAALRAHKKEKHGSPSLKASSTEDGSSKSFAKEHDLRFHQSLHTEVEDADEII
ncbi:gastrula zinc finger protein xFG20-1 [Nothobranchius furzeri]|uniref:Transcript variant X1 n=1 Tax=Nothobranchius furzeri TaxID=105023 RepID=A0A9D2XZ87_NOTFU|nr:transcript variant X3 [Nothobranchius furzeri]KAF7211026.1 transcript variant X2 [Nothobranchius furzeri]KAF7211027.1 transcript variant X4 [Nothobranchius furzeri]KAF7211028.1 transcript variant X1 [Nothobranchius furzeri]